MQEFINVVDSSPKRHRFQVEAATDGLAFVFKDFFSLPTLILMGAVVQTGLVLALPLRIAVTPTILCAALCLVRLSLEATSIKPNSYSKGVVPGKVSAQLPSTKTGRFGSTPAAQPVVVFMLAVRFNHPLGLFAPGVQDIVTYFQAMNADVCRKSNEFGLLGVSKWRAGDRADSNTLMFMYYFKDMKGLNDFAHTPVHRAGWDWYNRSKHTNIGIMHEAFQVPAGAYESIYVNSQPTLMGATTVKVQNEETGKPEWIRPLVAANKGVLKSQFGRMAKSSGHENEKYGVEPVWEGEKAS